MIHLNNVSFGYNNKHLLFKELELDIPPGNIYGLLGRNGAGKTSLLKIIAGLLFPREGEIEVMGYPPQDRHPDMLKDIHFIEEDLHVPALSVGKYLELHAPFYPRFDYDQFLSYLREFNLSQDLRLNKLSFGQRKKILLSFGLATNSRLLILDEPTNGLDIPSKSQFRKVLASAITPERIFIISTHQVRDLGTLIDPIIILEQGKIIFNQYLEEIHKRLYFHMEYLQSEPENVIYAERSIGGFMCVNENYLGEESDIDIEVLFNTVITQTDQIASIFSKTVQHES